MSSHKNEKDNHQIGTVHYMAPELIDRKPYDQKVDIWSAGTLLFEMCTGLDPFNSSSSQKIIQKIKNNEISYGKIVKANKDYRKLVKLIKLMLVEDPAKRLSATEVLMHKSLKKYYKKYRYYRGIYFDEFEDIFYDETSGTKSSDKVNNNR